MKAYKLFRVKKSEPGKLFPLYVLSDEPTPIGKWLPAKCGEMKDGKVKSKLGLLAYRPGWHLSDVPIATHIGIKENGVIKYMHDDEVWCECEFSDAVNYQLEANRLGTENGKLVPKKAMLRKIPENGYYRYKTNPNMLGDWIIAGAIKVIRVLSDAEAGRICREHGITPLPRKHDMNLSEYGFEEVSA